MHHFAYRCGVLHAEDVDLHMLAGEVDTPFYCYSTATLQRHYKVFDEAFDGVEHQVFYAMKANSNQAVIRTLADCGAGMDVVSEGELRRALAAGVPGRRIVFSGVGKTAREMALGLKEGINCFNVESEPELELLSEIANRIGTRAPVSLRVNPDIDAGTHEKITTGRSENKFGIPFAEARRVYQRARALPGVEVAGVDMHIGSQVTRLEPYEHSYRLMAQLIEMLREDGHDIRHAEMVKRTLGHVGVKLYLEPGRMIVGNAGILVSRVVYVKKNGEKTFIIADAAMNDLIRPTLYDAWHNILTVVEPEPGHRLREADVVGPVCESGDYLARNRPLPPLEAGDLIAIMTAGAYGAVQASTYNSRPLVAEILVKGDRFAIVRPRQSYEDLVGADRLAGWQGQ
jgi:diaminopimelate decarboxylase